MVDQEIYKLSERVIELAREKGVTIATAESCTGGWIGKALTDVPGSSKVLKGGVVAYGNDIKETILDVPKSMMIEHGAVSSEVAVIMAKNCAAKLHADLAISVTGIAGPGGGSPEKPVGLVFISVCHRGRTEAFRFEFEDMGRNSVREQVLTTALNLLIKFLQ